MRIGIEGQRLFRRKKHGMDVVAYEAIKNLQVIDNSNEYIVFVKQDEDRCLQSSGNFRVIELKRAPYPFWEQYLLPEAATEAGCEILHCTSNTAPLRLDIPLVVTLHDIIYMESRSLFSKGFSSYQKFGNMYRRMVVPGIVKNCRKLITVSESEKKRIAGFFHLDDSKIEAVYNGVSSHFKRVTDSAENAYLKKKYKLPDRFFFFFGNTDPKKNTRGVLQALSIFLKNSDEKIPLLMLDYDRKELTSLIQDIGDPLLSDHIILTGYIPNNELPGIYSLCSVFLYPSLRESFGIPILEAMACGVPVITSNTSSMPEVGGDAALFVDPYVPAQIADAMKKVIRNQDLRAELIDKGFKNASKFSWNAMAKNLLRIYKEIYFNKK